MWLDFRSSQTVNSAILIAFCAISLTIAFPFFGWTTDDSFITFRFAENLASGNGIVFNAGDPVEGYSNPLWMFLLAIVSKLGINIIIASKTIGFLCWIFTIWTADRILMQTTRKPVFRFSLAILLATQPALALYAVSGMETLLYTSILILYTKLAYEYFQNTRSSAGPLAVALLAALTRPDGILYSVLFVSLLILRRLYYLKKRNNINSGFPGEPQKDDFRNVVILFTVLLLIVAARYQYFGDLLPNTYYAKPHSSFSQNNSPWYGYVLASGQLIIPQILLLALYPFLLIAKRISLNSLVVALSIFPIIAFALYAGGDWMPLFRFILPAVPIIFVLSIMVLSGAIEGGAHKTKSMNRYQSIFQNKLAKTIFIAVMAFSTAFSIYNHLKVRHDTVIQRDAFPYDLMNVENNNKKLAQWLWETFPANTSILTKRIGYIPYVTKFKTFDLYALIHPDIAHEIHQQGSFKLPILQEKIADLLLENNPHIVLLHSKRPQCRNIKARGYQEQAVYKRLKRDYSVLGVYEFSTKYYTCVYVKKSVFTGKQISAARSSFPSSIRTKNYLR